MWWFHDDIIFYVFIFFRSWNFTFENCRSKIRRNVKKIRYRQSSNIRRTKSQNLMSLFLSCSCLWPIHWSQVLVREWIYSLNSADRRCSNYIWVINNFIAYQGASYISGLTVYMYIYILAVFGKCITYAGLSNIWQNLSMWKATYPSGLLIFSKCLTRRGRETHACHDDISKWKHFPRYWPFVRGIHRSPVNSLHKGQWRGALLFSLTCAWMNGWVNSREAGDLRRHCAHYDVTIMASVNYVTTDLVSGGFSCRHQAII